MVDASTTYTLLVMAGFILVALLVVHHHHCSDAVRRRRGEVVAAERHYGEKITGLERQIDDLSEKLLVVEEQLAAMEETR
ncbi:hypothetical protein [Pseudodesulfovibrio pelocollis]|uniref:hypothetical protein n=1 Tax=Pseudodesulfovibrio pelocollis TaxID=3051432 RepID=UPI00255AF7F9|nr:hypothetical protein [Pseudodesulfovibrio sp. SB368]